MPFHLSVRQRVQLNYDTDILYIMIFIAKGVRLKVCVRLWVNLPYRKCMDLVGLSSPADGGHQLSAPGMRPIDVGGWVQCLMSFTNIDLDMCECDLDLLHMMALDLLVCLCDCAAHFQHPYSTKVAATWPYWVI